MLIMNQAKTLLADCVAIYITSDEEGLWIKGRLQTGHEVELGMYESVEAAQKVLNGFICKHA